LNIVYVDTNFFYSNFNPEQREALRKWLRDNDVDDRQTCSVEMISEGMCEAVLYALREGERFLDFETGNATTYRVWFTPSTPPPWVGWV
jgi:hypothetical protein